MIITKSLVYGLIILLFSQAAWSSSTTDNADTNAQAKENFKKGLDLFDQGNFKEAAHSFEAAYTAHPSWKILFNIAQCAASLKQYGLALELFESYLLQGGDDIEDNRQKKVRDEIGRLRDLSGNLIINGTDGAVVYVDQKKRGVLPLSGSILIAGGVRDIKVMLGNEILLEKQIKMRGQASVQLTAEGIDKTSKNDHVKNGSHSASLQTAGWVLLGTGMASLVAAIVTGSVALKKSKNLKNICQDNICTSPDDFSKKKQIEHLSLVTDILLPSGAVIATTGLILLIAGKKKEQLSAFNKNTFNVVIKSGFAGLNYSRSF